MKAANFGFWSVKCPERLSQMPHVPRRLLMGPGPSNMPYEVSSSLTQPVLGHLHPEYLRIMDDVKEGIKYLFQTKNPLTFAVCGSGHAGMECALVNLLEKDEKLLVIENGFWGTRAADLGDRLGFDVKKFSVPLGEPITVAAFEEAVATYRPNAVFVCNGESSTGVYQSLVGMGEICHRANSLFLVDTVASLGAVPFAADHYEIDCVYSASQKVLNAPPGLAPISFSPRAVLKMRERKTRVPSFYFDALEIGNYWGCDGEPRRYHHTGSVSLVYSLRTALSELAKEGLEASIDKHYKNADLLYESLETLKLEPFVVKKEWRMPSLTTIKVPEGYDCSGVVDFMISRGVEIGGGLGPTAGKVWRVGMFGQNSNADCIKQVIYYLKIALEECKTSDLVQDRF